MSSEQIFILSMLSAIATSVIVPIVIKFFESRKTKSEEELNIAQAASEIIEGGDRATAAFERLLVRYENKNTTLEQKVDLQSQEISNLNARLIALQIDERSKDAKWETKFRAFEEYVALLVSILRENGIEIPPRPDVLKESGTKIKAITKEESEKWKMK